MPALDIRSIGIAVASIAGLPLAWNIVARNEYAHHTMERMCGGKLRGAYLLAALIVFFSFARDYTFHLAMRHNSPEKALPMIRGALTNAHLAKLLKYAGTGCIGVGTTFVVSSFMRLGITGTYLGDYFGILMKERVTAFPFNVLENPMYIGATLNFFGAAALENNGVGALLTGWVAMVYIVSTTWFENPFTAQIYARAAATVAATEAREATRSHAKTTVCKGYSKSEAREK